MGREGKGTEGKGREGNGREGKVFWRFWWGVSPLPCCVFLGLGNLGVGQRRASRRGLGLELLEFGFGFGLVHLLGWEYDTFSSGCIYLGFWMVGLVGWLTTALGLEL
jgi:hypothetical protein